MRVRHDGWCIPDKKRNEFYYIVENSSQSNEDIFLRLTIKAGNCIAHARENFKRARKIYS